MKPIPLHPNLPTPTTAFGNPAPIAQYYICPHCTGQSPLVREWVGLTDEEYIHITDSVYHKGHGLVAYYKAIEQALKEQNA